ncbi:MAG: hypothetical protein MZW92_15305 [Comamonadaceae bacterium]|nr:hypothetical protein [Comamonadaceae bacterium]
MGALRLAQEPRRRAARRRRSRRALALRALVTPFVYRKLPRLRRLRRPCASCTRKIRDEAQRRAPADRSAPTTSSSARGGIREIEFIAQVFQLIRGGRDPGAAASRRRCEALAAAGRARAADGRQRRRSWPPPTSSCAASSTACSTSTTSRPTCCPTADGDLALDRAQPWASTQLDACALLDRAGRASRELVSRRLRRACSPTAGARRPAATDAAAAAAPRRRQRLRRAGAHRLPRPQLARRACAACAAAARYRQLRDAEPAAPGRG